MKNSKEIILKKIQEGLSNIPHKALLNSETVDPIDDYEIFIESEEEIDILFAKEFKKLSGKFLFCEDIFEFKEMFLQLKTNEKWENFYIEDAKINKLFNQLNISLASDNILKNCHASISTCETLVARTGTIIISSEQQGGRTTNVYAPIHICIAYSHQISLHLQTYLKKIKPKFEKKLLPSLITFISGPSRTADIEKTLVVGIHGPKEVYLFLIDSNNLI